MSGRKIKKLDRNVKVWSKEMKLDDLNIQTPSCRTVGLNRFMGREYRLNYFLSEDLS